jgi:hypothetical protein
MFNSPFSGSIPIYIALVFFILSLALLMGFIYIRVHRLIRRLRRKPFPPVGVVTNTLRLLLILLVVALSAAALFLFAFIQSYTAFTHRELVAMVYCTPVEGGEDQMALWVVTLESPNAGYLTQYRLYGQKWALEGQAATFGPRMKSAKLPQHTASLPTKRIPAGAGSTNLVRASLLSMPSTATRYIPFLPKPRSFESTPRHRAL